MKTTESISQSWYKKALQEQDVFDRFVYLWFSFNALYNLHFDESERSAIKEWVDAKAGELNRQQVKLLLSSKNAQFFISRIIRDCRGNATDTSVDAGKVGNTANNPIYRLKSLLMIVYQVRCNLFHGNKSFLKDSDQEVVKNAAGVLEKILELNNNYKAVTGGRR